LDFDWVETKIGQLSKIAILVSVRAKQKCKMEKWGQASKIASSVTLRAEHKWILTESLSSPTSKKTGQ